MEYDITSMLRFFQDNLKAEEMPEAILRLTLSGNRVRFNDLETSVMEANQILDVDTIKSKGWPIRLNVPVLKKVTSEVPSGVGYYVYDSATGKRISSDIYELRTFQNT